MRSKNVVINFIMFMLYEAIVFVGNIIFPHFVIVLYGSQINGLTSTIVRILSLVNLIQAGSVGASIFQMYKPVAENDYQTQSEIIYASKKFYRKVVVLYIIISLIAGMFYSFYLQNALLQIGQIFIAFFILTINGAIQIYVFSISDVFFSPHQKKYYVTMSQMIYQIVNYFFQAIVMMNKLPFIAIYISMLIGTISGSVFNVILYQKNTKGLIHKNPKNKSREIQDRKYLMLACVGSELMTVSPTVIITTLMGLLYSSVFSVYSLIFVSIKTILGTIQISVSPIFGNLVKTSIAEKLYNTFDFVEYLTIMFGTLISGCVSILILPFATLYAKGATDINYVNSLLAIFVIVYIGMFAISTSFGYISTVYGLFRQLCKITFISSAVGITTSIIFTLTLGLPYVMLGMILFQLISIFTTNYVIKKNVSWYKIHPLFKRSLFLFINTVSFFIFSNIYPIIITNWYEWFKTGFIVTIIEISIITLYTFFFERNKITQIRMYVCYLFAKSKVKS